MAWLSANTQKTSIIKYISQNDFLQFLITESWPTPLTTYHLTFFEIKQETNYFAFGFLPYCSNLNCNFSFTYSNSLIGLISYFLLGNPLCIRNCIWGSLLLILFICKHLSIYYSLKNCLLIFLPVLII